VQSGEEKTGSDWAQKGRTGCASG